MDLFDEFKKYQLSKKDQEELIKKFEKTKCPKLKKEILLSFLPMALKLCTKLAQKHYPIVDLYCLLNQAYILMDTAIEKYCPQKAQLSTYIYNYLYWNLSEYIRNHYSIVKIHPTDAKKMKEQNISMTYISLEDINHKPYNNIKLYEEEEEEDYDPFAL